MTSTWPTREFFIGDPTPPIIHLLALGVGVGGNANFRVFRYQHVGIGNAKLWRWGSKPTRGPNANGFALQWNTGYSLIYHNRSYSLIYNIRIDANKNILTPLGLRFYLVNVWSYTGLAIHHIRSHTVLFSTLVCLFVVVV